MRTAPQRERSRNLTRLGVMITTIMAANENFPQHLGVFYRIGRPLKDLGQSQGTEIHCLGGPPITIPICVLFSRRGDG